MGQLATSTSDIAPFWVDYIWLLTLWNLPRNDCVVLFRSTALVNTIHQRSTPATFRIGEALLALYDSDLSSGIPQ